MITEGRRLTLSSTNMHLQNDCKLLSGYPFTGHGYPDNNLELLYMAIVLVSLCLLHYALRIRSEIDTDTMGKIY
jgi:hypothetical protein